MERRQFIGTLAAASVTAGAARAQQTDFDFVIIGAGTAGLPAAIFASRRGARVLLIDAADDIGGTLHLANGQISGGGTRIQDAQGIVDTPDDHYEDIMRITEGLCDPGIVRRTVDEAPATLNWLLDNGLTPLPDHPVTGSGPGRHTYTTARYIWGKNEGRDILAVVRKELEPELKSGRVQTLLNSTATELITDEAGAVTGVRVQTPDGEDVFSGRHILITTGGYAMNPELFQELVGGPAYGAGSYAPNQGKGLELAMSVGGVLRGAELHRCGTGSVMTAEEFPASAYARFETRPQLREPWEIWVNNAGQRFIREDEPMQEVRAAALAVQDRFRYAVVFDEQILLSSDPGMVGWSEEKVQEHFASHPMFHKAGTLDELAAKAGIDADGLKATVAEYNTAHATGNDRFGRTYMPRPIANPPYYAIIHLGSSATSSVGIVTDDACRVLTAQGEPIPNLYAAGEVLGSGATLGAVFTPGMMLTPALALGRWLGRTLPV
jgi:fumarate reductase flavoprotein subunit